MKTISVAEGTYKFVRDNNGLLVDVLRHDEHWAAGFESMRFSNAVHALLNRIEELEHLDPKREEVG